ncbi:hypothetical protein PIROE2DRAFT_57835 [Piromyces sp. E2]|nr:hypothetical protein PIROE2DRAFT_57835 [Piromyces sp. E2]|eukprot:OUM68877.1 hypothetical protein PIROE2DRAFT_57835 [Piromyces sp. E2]
MKAKQHIELAEMKKYGRRIAKLIRTKMEPQNPSYKFFKEKEVTPPHSSIKKINKKFMETVSQGDINEMVFLLEEENVNINKINSNGDTPLIIAFENGNFDAVRLLLTYEADLTLKDANGNLDVVAELLNQGVNVNSTGQKKNIALMVAAENGYPRVVKLLIKKGAKVTIKNESEKTALNLVNEKFMKLNIASGNNCKKKNKTSEYSYYEFIKNNLKSKFSFLNSKWSNETRIKENLSNTFDIVIDNNFEKDLKGWKRDKP